MKAKGAYCYSIAAIQNKKDLCRRREGSRGGNSFVKEKFNISPLNYPFLDFILDQIATRSQPSRATHDKSGSEIETEPLLLYNSP